MKQQLASQERRSELLAAAFTVVLTALVCALALPAAAHADSTIDDYAKVGNYSYRSDQLQDAMDKAAESGETLYMTKDWNLSGRLYVPEDKKVTIDMDGHRITAIESSVFIVRQKGELVVTSSKKATFEYSGYNSDGNGQDYTVTSGGLITSKAGTNTIRGKANSAITLDGIAIAGSYSEGSYSGDDDDNAGNGTVSLASNVMLNMKNGALIEHCSAYKGGGIGADGTGTVTNIDASSVSNNFAYHRGGGIYSRYGGSTIKLTESSHVDNNGSAAGGGIYFEFSQFTLTGDGTGTVSGNKATESSRTSGKMTQSGGGIHVTNYDHHDESWGLIENVTIAKNYSAYDGGGLELDHPNIKLKNCTIKDNWCKYEGGGIYVCNDGDTIENCTITGNACSVDSGGNYEGGGVFVWHSYDVELKGVCVIKGNTRGKDSGNADDIMLRENAGGSAKAYITGSLDQGSSVGVRTGYTSDRRIAKNFKCDTKDGLFADLSGYYVSYGTDEGGDAWQRHATKEFAAKISGEAFGKYRNGTAVALVAPLAKGDDRLFWRWDTERTTGLNPVGDYITSDNMYSNALAFKMPQNDVDATAVYATRATKVVLGIKAPVAGEDLPATAVVQRADGSGSTQEFPATVTWYEVEDGKKVLAAGKAKADTAYAASITCVQSPQGGLYFSKSFKAEGVTVKTTSGGDALKADSVSVDGATGVLTVVTAAFAETEGTAPAAKTGKVTVSKQKGALNNAASGKAQETSDGIMLLSADAAEPQGSGDSLGSVEVACSYAEDGSGSVTIAAPAQEGYNFCNWEDVPEGPGITHDDEAGTLTVPASMLEQALAVTAVYTPVVTKVELSMSAPEAGGDDLAGDAGEVKLTCSNGDEVDLAELFGAKSLPVTWSPEGEDGKAGYSTGHTAMIKVATNVGELVDVDKVVSADASVTAANGVEAEGAGFALLDGDLYLCVRFPETPDAQATGITQPADVELTFEQAKACSELGIWPLAKAVDVTVQSGVAAEGDIAWQPVQGFDANATGAQELAAHGTVTTIVAADGSEIDASGISHEVACKIKVAAPAQGGDEGDGQPASGDKAGKSALAKTSDSIPVLAVAAVAAIAIAAIAVAIVAARCRRQ